VLLLAFSKVKTILQDCRISDLDEIQCHPTTILNSITEMGFEECREQGNTDRLEVLLHKMTGSYSVTSATFMGEFGELDYHT
jgi:hypothetical protein